MQEPLKLEENKIYNGELVSTSVNTVKTLENIIERVNDISKVIEEMIKRI